jgi:hypothetical protein
LAGIPDTDTAIPTQKIDATKATKYKCLAVAFMSVADKKIYGKLLEELENDYTRGINNYPTTIPSAYNLLVNYKNYCGLN